MLNLHQNNTPYLLLDVDGVLCPFGEEYPEHAFVRFGDIGVHTTTENTRRLQELSAYYTIVWCTAWEDFANESIGPHHKLPILEVINFNGASLKGWRRKQLDTWKLPWVEAFVGDRSTAWIDDDLGTHAIEWANERPYPTKLIHTDCDIGLTDTHVEELREWAKSL